MDCHRNGHIIPLIWETNVERSLDFKYCGSAWPFPDNSKNTHENCTYRCRFRAYCHWINAKTNERNWMNSLLLSFFSLLCLSLSVDDGSSVQTMNTHNRCRKAQLIAGTITATSTHLKCYSTSAQFARPLRICSSFGFLLNCVLWKMKKVWRSECTRVYDSNTSSNQFFLLTAVPSTTQSESDFIFRSSVYFFVPANSVYQTKCISAGAALIATNPNQHASNW